MRREKAEGQEGWGTTRSARATVVHPAMVYVSPEDNATHVTEVLPGHEVVVMERNGAWIRVFANTDANDEEGDADKPEFSVEDNAHAGVGHGSRIRASWRRKRR